MRWLALSIFLISLGSNGSKGQEVLRLSRVLGEGADDAERMSLIHDESHSEELLVARKSVITEDDVEDAWVKVSGGRHQVSIEFKPAGADRLKLATGEMKLGADRMAMILEGKLIMAPVVQAVLSKSIVIHLADDSFEEASTIARKILGKPPLEPSEVEIPPLPETRPYTEEEYQTLKKQREAMGLHYLDALPTEAELDGLVARAATREEIVEKLGPPTFPPDESGVLSYHLAPEKLPANPDGEARPCAIDFHIENGKLSSWERNWWTTEPPRERVANPAPRQLKATLPKFDLAMEDPDLITPIENIKIPNIHQEVTLADLFDMLAVVWMPIQQQLDEESTEGMRADCDVLKFLSLHFPEMAKLRSTAKDGKIPLKELEGVIEPYFLEGKEVPDPQAEEPTE